MDSLIYFAGNLCFFLFSESQRKNAAMFDSDDDTSSVSSSSTMPSERVLNPGMDEVTVHKDALLDQSLDALYEKRYVFAIKVKSFILCVLLDFDANLIFWIRFFLDVKEFNERASFGLHC